MIRLILMMVMGALGYETTTRATPVRLAKQKEMDIMRVHPIVIVLALILLMILFVAFCFAFIPGTESGVYYHYKP